MLTQDEINQQIAAIPDAYVLGTKKEIKALPKIIDRNERIVALTSGLLNNKTWLAVCTTRRMLFINCNMVIGFEQVQMPLDRIQSIDHKFNIFFGSISIFDGVSVFNLRMVRKFTIMPFVKATEEAMFALKSGNQTGNNAPKATDVASQLEKLADLKEKGYLTEQEFQEQKKKLLAG